MISCHKPLLNNSSRLFLTGLSFENRTSHLIQSTPFNNNLTGFQVRGLRLRYRGISGARICSDFQNSKSLLAFATKKKKKRPPQTLYHQRSQHSKRNDPTDMQYLESFLLQVIAFTEPPAATFWTSSFVRPKDFRPPPARCSNHYTSIRPSCSSQQDSQWHSNRGTTVPDSPTQSRVSTGIQTPSQ